MNLKNPKKKVAIIGFGLIGSSIAKAIRKREQIQKTNDYYLIAYDTDNQKIQKKLNKVKKNQLIDEVGLSDYSDLNQSDLILICTPVSQMHSIFQVIKNNANENCIFTDCGSTKNSVIKDVKKVYGSIPKFFIPAHPLAGSEKTGFNSGCANLFKNKLCLICSNEATDSKAIKEVKQLWSLIGARIFDLDLSRHDNLLAHTSHLPHLLSFCLVNVLLDCDKNILDFASSGFAGISRLASSDADLWVDIFLNNKQEIFKALDHLQIDLFKAKDALENEDKQKLIDYFLRAKTARDTHIKKFPDIFK